MKFSNQQGKIFKNCPDCNTKIIDEFPKIDYVNCSGCQRIFERVKEIDPTATLNENLKECRAYKK